ncbi:PREDICTED: cyclin-U1-1 [Tarenaya hassleriana]|uniref:cyclin-U1-1 n=1 Tax=Tarenaya hassleriana TaxID=28532 RepID=UPI00053C386A|nr:PREDICTED: cyclin-U1-1 [Tarenaya hassleriana]
MTISMLSTPREVDEETGHVAEPDPVGPDAVMPRVLTVISQVLERLVARNDWLAAAGGGGGGGKRLEAFKGVRAPTISIPKYLERIYKYTNCSPSCFVVGYVYIDRLAHKHPGSLVVSLNVHRLLVTCVMVASKMLDDVHYNNAFYARVGGVSKEEMNTMEMELLFLLDFGLTVNSRVFEGYCFHLEREMFFLNDAVPPLLHTSSSPSLSSLPP